MIFRLNNTLFITLKEPWDIHLRADFLAEDMGLELIKKTLNPLKWKEVTHSTPAGVTESVTEVQGKAVMAVSRLTLYV